MRSVVERGNVPTGIDRDLLPDERGLRARALLAELHRLVVRTIHAWCRRLLAAWPLEARIHPIGKRRVLTPGGWLNLPLEGCSAVNAMPVVGSASILFLADRDRLRTDRVVAGHLSGRAGQV